MNSPTKRGLKVSVVDGKLRSPIGSYPDEEGTENALKAVMVLSFSMKR